MPLHPTDNGFRICYRCADGHLIERDITPSNADDVRRELDRKYYDRGTLNDYEYRQLLDGVQVAVDVQSVSSQPVPLSDTTCYALALWLYSIDRRIAAVWSWFVGLVRRFMARLIDAVGEWLGGERDQCCGK